MKFLRKRIYGINRDADAARLARIVAACNGYVARGQRVSIILGHTPGTDYQETLPMDIGADIPAQNFITDGLWVYADLETDPVFDSVVKRHPLVSVELFTDDVICPIAFMAGNRPAIEVGPLSFNEELPGVDLAKYAFANQREGEHSTFTLSEEDDTQMDVSAVKNLVSEILQNSELSAQIKTLTDTVGRLSLQVESQTAEAEKLKWLFDEEAEAEQAETPEGELPPDVAAEEAEEPIEEKVEEDAEVEAEEHPELPPEEIEKIAEDHVAEGKEEEKNPETPEVEEKNEMALPSGTNTFVPGTDTGKPKKKNYEELELESETYRLAAANQETLANSYAGQIAAEAEAKNAALAHAAAMERKYAMLARKNELIVLSQKYQFDPEAEMAVVEAMTDEQFATHKSLVVTRYSMPPVHKAPVSVGDLPAPKGPEPEVIPQKTVARIAKYAMEKKITWDEAKTELKL